MRKRWLKLTVLPLAFAFAAAACGTEDDDDAADTEVTEAPGDTEGTEAPGDTEGTEAPDGTTQPTTAGTVGELDPSGIEADPALAGTSVDIFGIESSAEEAGAMQAALDVFAEVNDMTITYVGARDFEEQINTQVSGGNPPDIATFPQPGKVAAFAESGDLQAVPEEVVTSASEHWSESWMSFGNVDGTQYAVPWKSDLKSLVWYIPSSFEEKGYTVPETLTDFFALVDEMIANDDTPLCVGIESGPATGWPFTDWTEELILRNEGIDYYNQWVAHEVPFNDPPVVEAMTQVIELWNKEGAVFAPGGSIAATPFGDNGEALVNGSCMMHRQANFFSAFMPEGTEFGEGAGAVTTFYFPSDEGEPVLVGGQTVAAFRDAPEVWAVIEYFASPEYANNRQAAQVALKGGGEVISGFLSANLDADPSLYTELEQGFLEVLETGDPAGFDASDQMPAEVGSGSFWREATALVNGETDPEGAADAIEDSWPS